MFQQVRGRQAPLPIPVSGFRIRTSFLEQPYKYNIPFGGFSFSWIEMAKLDFELPAKNSIAHNGICFWQSATVDL
jgi:hypothetical protein